MQAAVWTLIGLFAAIPAGLVLNARRTVRQHRDDQRTALPEPGYRALLRAAGRVWGADDTTIDRALAHLLDQAADTPATPAVDEAIAAAAHWHAARAEHHDTAAVTAAYGDAYALLSQRIHYDVGVDARPRRWRQQRVVIPYRATGVSAGQPT
jgi:hypothetical protein